MGLAEFKALKNGEKSWQTREPFCKTPFEQIHFSYNGRDQFFQQWERSYVALKEANFRRQEVEYLRYTVLPSFALGTWGITAPFFICANTMIKRVVAFTPFLAVTIPIILTRKDRDEQFLEANKAFVTLRQRNIEFAKTHDRLEPYDRENVFWKTETEALLKLEQDPKLFGTPSVRAQARTDFSMNILHGTDHRAHFEEMI
jgi:hypothetical protein